MKPVKNFLFSSLNFQKKFTKKTFLIYKESIRIVFI